MPQTRRTILLAAAATFFAPAAACAAQAREITIYKTPWCGCCGGWVKRLQAAGFTTEVVEVQDLAPVRARHGVPFELSSCHTGVAGGYVFEGHVPVADVERVLKEKPKALGLAVPGMPIGSPGMEVPNGKPEAFDTLLLLKDGTTKVFARHGA
ncbi:MAG TPA: DUF411 domain-containing protein [Caulobacteraceae bacterium]|nr:DUF411 domain-containing protein [Caulobacteraceae bacterium]